jgi:hypothetical protein
LSQQTSGTLAAAEASFLTGHWVKVDPNADPTASLPQKH